MKYIEEYNLFESVNLAPSKIIVVKIFIYDPEEGEIKIIGISKGKILQNMFDELIIALSKWINVDEEEPGDWRYEIPENSTTEKLEKNLRNWADSCGWYAYENTDKMEVEIFELPPINQDEIRAINLSRRILHKPNIEIHVEYAEAFDEVRKNQDEIENIVDKLAIGRENKKIIDFILSS